MPKLQVFQNRLGCADRFNFWILLINNPSNWIFCFACHVDPLDLSKGYWQKKYGMPYMLQKIYNLIFNFFFYDK